MKKLFSVFVCLCLVLCLVGCDNSKKFDKNAVDFEYFAKLGKIPEVEYTLGEDAEKITSHLKSLIPENQEETPDHSHDHNKVDFYFAVEEGNKNVLLDNGTVGYYYNKVNKKKGISFIVNYDTAFGFELGTVSVEIKKALKDYKFTEENISEDNAFFATYILNGTVLKTEIENVVIMFVFQENELFATAIYDANNWTF